MVVKRYIIIWQSSLDHNFQKQNVIRYNYHPSTILEIITEMLSFKIALNYIQYRKQRSIWMELSTYHGQSCKNKCKYHSKDKLENFSLNLSSVFNFSPIHLQFLPLKTCFVFNWGGMKPRRSPNKGVRPNPFSC